MRKTLSEVLRNCTLASAWAIGANWPPTGVPAGLRGWLVLMASNGTAAVRVVSGPLSVLRQWWGAEWLRYQVPLVEIIRQVPVLSCNLGNCHSTPISQLPAVEVPWKMAASDSLVRDCPTVAIGNVPAVEAIWQVVV